MDDSSPAVGERPGAEWRVGSSSGKRLKTSNGWGCADLRVGVWGCGGTYRKKQCCELQTRPPLRGTNTTQNTFHSRLLDSSLFFLLTQHHSKADC
jgi:hypothetical protein